MDKTIKLGLYTRMCKEASEIQEIFKKDRDKLGSINYLAGENPVWLPSQEQLEDMIQDSFERTFRDFVLFSRRYFQTPRMDKDNIRLTSIPQIFLAYIMKKKYNKIWTGITWQIEI